jgi:hypothetical protein
MAKLAGRELSKTFVKPHTGARDAKGALVAFANAPAHFRPNLTPRQMLEQGMHGGIYFNPKGGKPGVLYPRHKYPNGIPGVGTDEFPAAWFEGIDRSLYASRKYDVRHNRHSVKSGQDQAAWESSGWIDPVDPRGWTQWFFRFYQGRRLEGEDARQISRWSGVCGEKGRWKQNLIAKCMCERKEFDDTSVSPVVRQTLLHWAYELTRGDFEKGAKRVAKRGASYVPQAALAVAGVKKLKAPAAGDDDGPDVDAAARRESAAAREGATASRAARAAKRKRE